MKKLVPLFAIFTTTACGPELLDRELQDIPGMTVHTDVNKLDDTESFSFGFDWERGGPCYRVPANTRLTVNGESFSIEERGESVLSFDGSSFCRSPSFKGALRPASETRTEIVLSDGHTSKRAVFQELRAERRLRVNGQDQATLHVGDAVDVEWLTATDRLNKVDAALAVEGNTKNWQSLATPTLEGNHIRFTFPKVSPGRYVLSLYGMGLAGVEVCDGFIDCKAFVSERIEVPVVVE